MKQSYGPVLCFDRSTERLKALRVLQRAKIPFRVWDARLTPSKTGRPPFLIHGHKSYWGLPSIRDFARAYRGIRKAELTMARILAGRNGA